MPSKKLTLKQLIEKLYSLESKIYELRSESDNLLYEAEEVEKSWLRLEKKIAKIKEEQKNGN